MERFLSFTVSEPDIELTVGDFLRKKCRLTPRQISHAKFIPDGICKNGIQCRVSDRLSAGDHLSVCLEQQSCESSHLSASGTLPVPEILYEDEDVLAAYKPAGILTHPSGRHYDNTLANQIASYFRQKGLSVRIRPVGRLDKETSGIVLFAKNQAAAQRLQAQRQEHIFQKEYLAVTDGQLPYDPGTSWCTVSFPVFRQGDHPLRMCAWTDDTKHLFSSDSILPQSAVTHYRVSCCTPQWSLAVIRLETGRTHQIRVHMQALGHPLLGDSLYQDPASFSQTSVFKRTALHAWKVTFRQPFAGYTITLEAPLPQDFQDFIHAAGLV